ncbi:MAG: substrate-binding domain-containing protein [Oscillospiraceae bacterium]|nr:substrate-binding domain-containing protein [Oscillospiraceae bacterium]
MKKAIVAIVALLCAGALVACSGGGQDPSSTGSPGAPADTAPIDTTQGAENTPEAGDGPTAENTPETMSGKIVVNSREDGSGTRGAFVELFEVVDGDKNDITADSAEITNSTAVMMTSVAGDKNAIGYVSLGSLGDTVKAVAIDGVEATTANVASGTYKVARPFFIATVGEPSAQARDFIDFIMSSVGQDVIEANGYIRVDDTGPYAGGGTSGKVVVAGSSSVTPVMEKLKEAYLAVNPAAEIEIQMSDSTTGMNSVIDGICDICMASRDIKDSEAEKGAEGTRIAIDGIAVIVNRENPISGLAKEQVRAIYTGEITDWTQLGG